MEPPEASPATGTGDPAWGTLDLHLTFEDRAHGRCALPDGQLTDAVAFRLHPFLRIEPMRKKPHPLSPLGSSSVCSQKSTLGYLDWIFTYVVDAQGDGMPRRGANDVLHAYL